MLSHEQLQWPIDWWAEFWNATQQREENGTTKRITCATFAFICPKAVCVSHCLAVTFKGQQSRQNDGKHQDCIYCTCIIVMQMGREWNARSANTNKIKSACIVLLLEDASEAKLESLYYAKTSLFTARMGLQDSILCWKPTRQKLLSKQNKLRLVKILYWLKPSKQRLKFLSCSLRSNWH